MVATADQLTIANC